MLLFFIFFMALSWANSINPQTISAYKLKTVDKNWANAARYVFNFNRFTFPYNKGSTSSVVLISEGHRFVNFSKVDKSFKTPITKINF